MRRVVVTGMGAIGPTGKNVKEIWQSAMDSKHGIGPISRFDTTEFKVKLAAEIKDYDVSDYYDKSEARRMDLFTQYALIAATEAMTDSKLKDVDPYRFGVYIGSGIGGMNTFSDEYEKLETKGPKRVSVFFIPMLISNMAAGQVAIKYGAKGSAMSTVTACSSSANAIGEAYRAILHGYMDVVLSGGTEAAITPIGLAGFSTMGAVSFSEDPHRASIPFDKERNGFVMGEGAAVLLLEELEHAKKRDATIYAEVIGYGSTCDAHHMTAPEESAEGATRAIKDSLQNMPPGKIYVNAHGTSTPLNDVLETKAIKGVFEDQLEDVHVSSTKSMTGHLLGAAGAMESIYCIKALNHSKIPPTLGLKVADPECDLDYTPDVPKDVELSTAISISLGFGGHNACVAFGKYHD